MCMRDVKRRQGPSRICLSPQYNQKPEEGRPADDENPFRSFVSGPESNGTKPHASIKDIQSYVWQPYFEDMLSVYGVNVLGVYFTTVAFLELLNLGNQASNVVQRSRVIATGSISGLNSNIPHGFAYSSSKAAVTHLMKQMATFLAPHGIRRNVLVPGSKFGKLITRGDRGQMYKYIRPT